MDRTEVATSSAGKDTGNAPFRRHVALLILVQLLLGLPFLRSVPRLYNDDAWEASLGYCLAFEGSLRHGIIEGWGGMDRHFVQNQVVQPFVLAALYRVAGFGIFTSRLASVLVAAVALVGVYAVMRHWLGARLALWAALGTAIHPWFFEIARRVRPDIYVIALAFVALWMWLRAVEQRGRTWAFVAGLLAGLAGLAHPTGFVFCAAMAMSLLVWQRVPGTRHLLLWVFTGVIVALLPYVLYVFWAVQQPGVSFLGQMRGGKPVVLTGLGAVLSGEAGRWAHFLQWPKGAALAGVLALAWVAAWFHGTRSDRIMATVIIIFAAALPFSTVNYTSRYLVGLVPLFAALLVRLIARMLGHAGGSWPWHRRMAGTLLAGIYVLTCLAAVGVLVHRLRGADLESIGDRIAVVAAPDDRVYGEMLLWFVQDGRYRYGPFPLDEYWRTSVADLRRHRFDYAVRSAWTFASSHGIASPPVTMPDWREGYPVDDVCRQFGECVANFRDPFFGPMEIYRLSWEHSVP